MKISLSKNREKNDFIGKKLKRLKKRKRRRNIYHDVHLKCFSQSCSILFCYIRSFSPSKAVIAENLEKKNKCITFIHKKHSFIKNIHSKRTHRWPTWPCFSNLTFFRQFFLKICFQMYDSSWYHTLCLLNNDRSYKFSLIPIYYFLFLLWVQLYILRSDGNESKSENDAIVTWNQWKVATSWKKGTHFLSFHAY